MFRVSSYLKKTHTHTLIDTKYLYIAVETGLTVDCCLICASSFHSKPQLTKLSSYGHKLKIKHERTLCVCSVDRSHLNLNCAASHTMKSHQIIWKSIFWMSECVMLIVVRICLFLSIFLLFFFSLSFPRLANAWANVLFSERDNTASTIPSKIVHKLN